jgi:hypothetical protein
VAPRLCCGPAVDTASCGARVGPPCFFARLQDGRQRGRGRPLWGSTWLAARLLPGLLGWWRSPEASYCRRAGRPAEAGPRPPLRGAPAAAAVQPLLSSHSQAAPARGPRRHGRGSRVAAAAGGGPQQGEVLPPHQHLTSCYRVFLPPSSPRSWLLVAFPSTESICEPSPCLSHSQAVSVDPESPLPPQERTGHTGPYLVALYSTRY